MFCEENEQWKVDEINIALAEQTLKVQFRTQVQIV